MSDYDIVCIGPHNWSDGPGGEIWRRRHHLMTNLAKKHRVLFVETAFFSPFQFLGSILTGSLKGSPVQKVPNNLWVLKLFNPLPFQETALRRKVGIVKWINDRTCLYQIRKTLRYLKINRNVLLWAYYTNRTLFLMNKLGCDFIVCDVYDKYTEYATFDEWAKKFTMKQEKIIFQNSDVVFAVSEPLLHYCQRYNDNCHLVPNGVDEIFFRKDTQCSETPEDLGLIPPPRIGYVGSVFDKLDYKLLIEVVKKCKNYSFVFIGPMKLIDSFKRKQFNILRSLPNTFWLGAKKVEQLPQYYRGLDVCIAPYDTAFKQIDWCDMPLKVMENLAVGKTLIVPIGKKEDFAELPLMMVAKSSNEFIEKIDLALNSDLSKHINEGTELARVNTWPKRVIKMEKIIERCWSQKTEVDV